jgi:hypothetical protein
MIQAAGVLYMTPSQPRQGVQSDDTRHRHHPYRHHPPSTVCISYLAIDPYPAFSFKNVFKNGGEKSLSTAALEQKEV